MVCREWFCVFLKANHYTNKGYLLNFATKFMHFLYLSNFQQFAQNYYSGFCLHGYKVRARNIQWTQILWRSGRHLICNRSKLPDSTPSLLNPFRNLSKYMPSPNLSTRLIEMDVHTCNFITFHCEYHHTQRAEEGQMGFWLTLNLSVVQVSWPNFSTSLNSNLTFMQNKLCTDKVLLQINC